MHVRRSMLRLVLTRHLSSRTREDPGRQAPEIRRALGNLLGVGVRDQYSLFEWALGPHHGAPAILVLYPDHRHLARRRRGTKPSSFFLLTEVIALYGLEEALRRYPSAAGQFGKTPDASLREISRRVVRQACEASGRKIVSDDE